MTSDIDAKATLIRADDASSRSSGWSGGGTLPPDLQEEALRRLRVSALLYALAFVLAGPLASLLSPGPGVVLLAEPAEWLPPTLSIAGALAVAWIVSRPGLPTRLKLRAGLAFEVLGSFGIAAAQYHDIVVPLSDLEVAGRVLGLSWVAPFVLLHTIMVPARPRTAIAAAALALASVPLAYGAGVALGSNTPLDAGHFFFGFVFPYVVVLVMVYVGSRVVYGLGTAVRRARELGSYRLVERLGQGGMGEVWRARHRMLARPAAIKLIRPEVLGATNPESRQLLVRRFEREAQATALLRSVHTIQLYDFGVADDGTFYYVMELLDGFDLNELVERFGPLPAERVVHLLLQMCASLAEAHEAGLIHRDVKPANIYACRYGREADFIKVLDFGLVKHGPKSAEGDARLTADLVAGGTPAFMSPEQALGEDHLDGRSDLYAVGCVAYWLLTGSLVFRGGTALETIVMHVSRDPEPPSRRTTLPIPSELEAIVLACLAKDPGARPRTADELAARLASVRTTREWTTSRAHEWWDEHRPMSDHLEAVPGERLTVGGPTAGGPTAPA